MLQWVYSKVQFFSEYLTKWDETLSKDIEEKEQIENAYWASYKEGQYSGDKTAEEYYNETYNQNK